MNQEEIDKLPGANLEANSTKDSNPRPSPGLMARPGRTNAQQSEGRAGEIYLPVGGRVRKLRAIEDQPGHPMKRGTSELGGII
jgi:hypothetical protein